MFFAFSVDNRTIRLQALDGQRNHPFPKPFITTWNTGDDTSITIPTTGSGYDYSVYWENTTDAGHNGILTNQTSSVTIDFGTSGTYRVEIHRSQEGR